MIAGVNVVHVLGITAVLLGRVGPIQATVPHLGPEILVVLNSIKRHKYSSDELQRKRPRSPRSAAADAAGSLRTWEWRRPSGQFDQNRSEAHRIGVSRRPGDREWNRPSNAGVLEQSAPPVWLPPGRLAESATRRPWFFADRSGQAPTELRSCSTGLM